ncbi:MAG: hypothetical protein ACLGJC_04430 [Alphaproteobacteria bacterium]
MAKALKIPKKIGGVKVPKQLRKSGKSLTKLLDSPVGRQALAAALTAAAGVLAGSNKTVREGIGEAGSAVAQTGSAVAHTGSGAAGLVRDVAQAAVGAVAETVADKARDLIGPGGKDQRHGDKHGFAGNKAH